MGKTTTATTTTKQHRNKGTFKSEKQDFKRNGNIFSCEILKLIQAGTSFAELHLAADLAFLVFLLDKEKL